MKIGTQKIEDIIMRQLKQANARMNCGYGKFAKDLTKQIVEALPDEDDMQIDMREEYLKRGGTPEVISVYDRLCKALGFIFMPLTPKATDVYGWIVEQERNGQKLETFAVWAKNSENVKFIKQYKNNPENIMTNWPQAFQQIRMLAGEERI